MKNSKVKFIICGIVIFALGIFIGNQITYGTHTSLQGYLYNAPGVASNSNASNSNASSSNASSSNASSSNASSSNASSANASSANASITDNIIYLQDFDLYNKTANVGDKVEVLIRTSGAHNSGASIVFKSNNGMTFTAQVQNISGSPYIIIPTTVTPATYRVTDVLLIGTNSDHTTFTKQYSESSINPYTFNSTLTVNAKNDGASKIVLNSLTLGSNSAKIGDKVNVGIQTNEKTSNLKYVEIDFISSEGKLFSTRVKDLTGNPYIEIPSSVVPGTYTVVSMIIGNSNGPFVFTTDGNSNTEKFNFNNTIEILDGNGESFIYNNEDITSEILSKLYNAPAGSRIVINADSNSIINEELFNTIKGKNKKLVINYGDNQIIFNGEDVKSPKTIDLTMNVDDVSANDAISKLASKGVVVNFPDNGNLPGKATVRVKATNKVQSILEDIVFVYIFNKSSNNFCEIATNVKKTGDGYYEFAITHNSDFLITNKELPKKLVVAQNEDNVVSFLKSKKVYLLLIAIGIIVIIAVIVVIVILKKKNKTTDKKEEKPVKEETKEEKE